MIEGTSFLIACINSGKSTVPERSLSILSKKVFKSAWISGCYFYSGEGKKLYKGITQDYNTLIYDEEDLRNRLNGVKHRFTEFDYEWDETNPLFADNFRWLNQGNNNLVPVFAPHSQFQLKQLK